MTDTAASDVKHLLTDPRAVCERLGLTDGSKPQSGGLSIRCPSHNERNPSCSVTNADGTIRVKCFVCDLAGDVYSLIAAAHRLDVRHDFARVLAIAAELAGVTVGERRPALRSVPAPATRPEPALDLTAEWDALLPVDEDGWEYLRSRGLADGADLCRSTNESTPDELGWYAAKGYRLAQALRDTAGRVVAIQVRRLDGDTDEEKPRFLIRGQASAGLFGNPVAVAKARNVVVCEGFTDTLAASIAYARAGNVAVVGVPGVKTTASLGTLPLTGKRVAVIFDADAAGDAAATSVVADLDKRGAVARRIRPSTGKDLADMARAGVDIAAFVRAQSTGFRSVAESVRDERQARVAVAGQYLPFGVKFLDAALGGMAPADLVLVGAATGRGKTQFVLGVGRHNALEQRRVHYFALEADPLEHERRLKYPIIAQLVYEERIANGDLYRRLNYLDWLQGKFDGVLDLYERAAEATIAAKYRSLFLHYKGAKDFGRRALEQSIRDVADETDLIAIDHLNYVDTEGVNENREIRDVVKMLRNVGGEIGKPIILVAHIRKGQTGKKRALVPSIEEFHGTSDTAKIATKAIMIAPAPDQTATQKYLAPTYIEPAKCRADGSRTYFVGLVDFNYRTGRYEDDYALGKLDGAREKFTFVDGEDVPAWALKRAGTNVIGGVQFGPSGAA